MAVALRRLQSLLRAKDLRSDDPREIQRLLDRGLERWMRDDGDPVQFIGSVHTAHSYAQWRSTQLERMPGAFVPMLTPGC
jgi:hypothetical protein